MALVERRGGCVPRQRHSIYPEAEGPTGPMNPLVVFFAVFIPLSILRHYRLKRRRTALLKKLVDALAKKSRA